MKPFDLELAKAGHPVCTRDGKPVRIVCFDRKNTDGCSIIALVDKGKYENFMSFFQDGSFFNDRRKDKRDLFMATVKKEGWLNLYKEDGVTHTHGSHIYPSEEEALDCSSPINYLTTVKIEWEE